MHQKNKAEKSWPVSGCKNILPVFSCCVSVRYSDSTVFASCWPIIWVNSLDNQCLEWVGRGSSLGVTWAEFFQCTRTDLLWCTVLNVRILCQRSLPVAIPAITLMLLQFFTDLKNSHKWLIKSKPVAKLLSHFDFLNHLRNLGNLRTHFVAQIPLYKFDPGKYFHHTPQPVKYLITNSYRHIPCKVYH